MGKGFGTDKMMDVMPQMFRDIRKINADIDMIRVTESQHTGRVPAGKIQDQRIVMFQYQLVGPLIQDL